MKAKKITFQNPSLDFGKEIEMYVIKDDKSFVFAIPSENFTIKITNEKDFDDFVRTENVFVHADFRKEVVSKMKKLIAKFD